MQRLYKNSQVKRIIARLLVVLICINYFINSLCSGIGVITAEADSNDRRRTWIELSQGKQTTELTEIENIDKESLRIIALYLSNYYIPFSTVLAGQAGTLTTEGDTDEEASDAEKEITNYQQIMTDALVNDLGFDKEAASYLVGLTVESSLASCQMLFVESSVFTSFVEGCEHSHFSSSKDKNEGGSGEDDGYFQISDIDKYKSSVTTKSASLGETTTEFVSVSYAMLLDMLNEDSDDKNLDIKFYWIDNGVAKEVFSNSESMKLSYVLSNQRLDYDNGIGSSFIAVPESVAGNYMNNDDTLKVLSPFMSLYIDWVGNIVCNIGTGAVVILPACMNPNTFDYITEVDNTSNTSDPLNFVNSICAYEMQKNHIQYSTDIVTGSIKGYYGVSSETGEEVQVYTQAEWDELDSNVQTAMGNAGWKAYNTKEQVILPVHKSIPIYGVKQYDYYDDYNNIDKPNILIDNIMTNGTLSIPGAHVERFAERDADFKAYAEEKGISITSDMIINNIDALEVFICYNSGMSFKDRPSIKDLKDYILVVYAHRNNKGYDSDLFYACETYYIQYNADGTFSNTKIFLNSPKYAGAARGVARADFEYVNLYHTETDSKDKENKLFYSSSVQAYKENGEKTNGVALLTTKSGQTIKNSNMSEIETYMMGLLVDGKTVKKLSYINPSNELHTVDFTSTGFQLNTTKKDYTKFYSSVGIVENEIYLDEQLLYGSGYNVYVYDGSQSLLNLYRWREYFGSNVIDFDKDKSISLSPNNSKTMTEIYEAMTNAGAQPYTGGNDYTGENHYAFPRFYGWKSNRGCTKSLDEDKDYKLVGSQQSDGTYDSVYSGHTNLIYYDTLEEITDETILSDLFKSVDMYSVIKNESDISSTSLQSSNMDYIGYTDAEKAIASISGGSGSKFAPCMFYTYVFAYFNKDATNFVEADNIINMKLTLDNYPQVTGAIDWEFTVADTTGDEIMSFVYYLLHPTKGIQYVATWFKNKVSGILVGWHEDIVGSSDSNSSTGVTRYLGFTGYTTLPSLYDVEWIAGILNSYNNIIVYLIILIAVILLCYILTGNMTTQRGILGLLMFSILAFLPPVAINAVVNTTNRVSDTIYGDKFDYWALVQMQQYIIELDNAKELKEQGDMTSYANFIISNYTSASTSDSVGGASETGYTGVKLKWVSPKKYNITANVSDAMDSVDTDADYIKTILLNTVANNISGESYLDSESALYLYRDYLDIYRYASCSYNLYTTFNFAGEIFNDSTMNIGGVATTGSNSVVDVWSQAQVHTGSFVSGIQANATDSELLSTMKYTSGVPLATLILANAEGSSAYSSYFISPDFVPTSSLFATRKGFLYRNAGYTIKTQGDITEYSDSISSEKIIYYNQDTTLATSLLLNYTDAYEQVAKNRHSFQTNIIDATDTPKVEYTAMKNGDVVWGIDSYHFNYDVANITGQKTETNTLGKYTDLSYYYYGLYTESPFYFFSFNIQDQLNTAKRDTTTGVSYKYNYDRLQDSSGSMKALFLHDNQNYFFNLENTSGDGYGEMRDYMNMHDFFYYIVPVLREGTNLVKEFDDIYGMYTYDSCPLYFQSDGTFIYGSAGSDANKYEKLDDNFKTNCWDKMNDQEKYEFWHDYNVNTLFNQYSAWLDTMLDCDYADSETIEVAGEKFVVRDPLDPTSYFTYDESTGKITAGRYMVFSRSEMKYYGLSWEDLTQVEQKIITVQDNVYAKSIDLMNYYTLSDETLIQAYAMIQLFEFNKAFSQTSLVSDDYILYPQSYELKAFTYDAYLRLIISGTTGEDLMTTADNTDPTNVTTNVSIYQRVLENTSIFFGIVLLINDFIAVYILPAFKLFFLLLVFFMSIAMIVSSAIKLELNLVKAVWSSLLAPMLSFALVSIGMAWLVSKFMSEGAQGVVQTSHLIQLGDPTMVICVMVVINVVALILYFKILKKAFKDLVNYVKAISASISGAVVGTLGSVTGAFTNGRKYDGSGSSSARTAKQRGADNDPKSGKSGLRPAITGAALGAGANEAHDAAKQAGLKSKYDSKAYNKLEAKKQKQQDKLDRFSQKAEQKQNRLDAKENKLRQGGNKEKLERFLAKREKGMDKSIRKMDKLQNNSSYYAKKQANIKNMGRLGALKANTKLSVGRKFQQVGSAGASVVNTASSVASGAKRGATVVRNGASSVKKGAKKAYNVVRDAKLSDIPTGISTGVRTCAKNTGRYITKAGRNVVDKAKVGADFAKHNVVKGYNNTINS